MPQIKVARYSDTRATGTVGNRGNPICCSEWQFEGVDNDEAPVGLTLMPNECEVSGAERID